MLDQVYTFSIEDVLQTADSAHHVRFARIQDGEMGEGPAKGVEFDPDYMRRMINVGRQRAGRWDISLPEADDEQ